MNNYKRVAIMAANKKHFDSLVNSFRRNFITVTSGEKIAEFENESEFITITIYPVDITKNNALFERNKR